MVVNRDEQNVFFLGYVAGINNVDEASIHFGGRQMVGYGFSAEVRGNIDRVTAHMDTTLVMSDPTQPHDPITATIHYDMVCKANSN